MIGLGYILQCTINIANMACCYMLYVAYMFYVLCNCYDKDRFTNKKLQLIFVLFSFEYNGHPYKIKLVRLVKTRFLHI